MTMMISMDTIPVFLSSSGTDKLRVAKGRS
jgi:hypothetical protein